MNNATAQKGMTLVELMIALTLGLLVTLIVSQIFLSNKTSTNVQDALSRVQENGRWSMQLLSLDARMSGNVGCNKSTVISNIVALPSTGASWVKYTAPIGGYSQTSLPPGLTASEVLSGTDVIMFQYADNLSTNLAANLSGGADNISISVMPSRPIQIGDILVVSDCMSADVFAATSVSGSGPYVIGHAAGYYNTSSSFATGVYRTDADLMRMVTNIYFVACMSGSNPTATCSSTSTPYLWRKTLSGNVLVAQDLVEGVENMQILYGEDKNGDTVADQYVTAANVTDWTAVVGIRFTLLLRTIADNLASTAQTYTFNGNTVNATDRRIRRVYTSTINLRNRTY